jgi:hypothetical protein
MVLHHDQTAIESGDIVDAILFEGLV